MTKGTVRSLIRWIPLTCFGLLIMAMVAITVFSPGLGTPWENGEGHSALEVIRRLHIVEILSWSWL
ncbi:hypothetical protein [Chitinophaga niabensis]|uniref:hypothetical protein n=1 Tax=Chitinophaga niabensis TaxID=536979 RepID=UPI0011614920|nr:hypothetical protein [Chitinophaga niabensis]